VALFLSFCLFIFLFFLILAPRSDSSEPPPPLLSSSTFRFTSLSSDLVLYGRDLLEDLGGSRQQQTLSLLSARLFLSSGRRDLLRPWMFGGHRVWGLLSVQDFIVYPIFGVDLSKLFFLKSPKPRIAWHLLPWPIQFDFSVVCLAGIKAPNLLLFQTSLVVVTLVIFWILVKFCVVWCYYSCVVCCCCCCCCDVVVVIFSVVKFSVVFLLYCFAALFVGSFAVTNVTFTTLYVGFYLPLCRVVV
jgi:hypothetical protein